MRFRRFMLPLVAVVASSVSVSAAQTTHAWTSGEQINLAPWLSPDPTLSTSGDFATDTYGDPWDFKNAEDVPPINGVGVNGVHNPSIAKDVLSVDTDVAAEIRLVMKWPRFSGSVLPWGRDGWNHPID